MENPKAILFDLDDTIIEFEVLARPAWKATLSAMASQLHGRPVEKVRASIGRVSAQWWSDPERHCQGRLDLTNTRQRNVADAFALLGIDDDRHSFDGWQNAERSSEKIRIARGI